MFHTAVNNTRQTLRKATDLREPMFITHVGGRYRLDPNLVDVDLWRFLHALNAAADAERDRDGVAALRRLAGLYTSELADDLTHEWAELERETTLSCDYFTQSGAPQGQVLLVCSSALCRSRSLR